MYGESSGNGTINPSRQVPSLSKPMISEILKTFTYYLPRAPLIHVSLVEDNAMDWFEGSSAWSLTLGAVTNAR